MPDSFITPGEVLNANGQSAVCGVSGYGGVAFQIQGTFDATLTFQASLGSEWVDMRVTASDSSTPVSTATDPGVYIGSVVGFTSVRVIMSDRNSGAAHVLIRADVASPGGAGGGGGAGSNVNLIEVGGASIALGEAVMADSLPVVIASDQTPIPITGSITAENNAAGPVGDPIPADASSTAYEGPTGDLETFKLESFDYDTGAGSDPTTAIGLKIPGSGGGVAVGSANPLPISAASLPLPSGAATAANQQTDALTDAELRATPVPVSGTVSTGGLTDAELRATPVPVSGTVTANAGTNLNTSALALESGGNLAAIAASASVLDDWDESDRAKVNPIVGQAGVQGGAGAVSATTQRVVLATDTTVPNVTGNVAADSADSGNPVKIGMIAYSPDGTTPGTAVAELDRSNAKSDLDGRLLVNPYHPRTLTTHLDGSSAYTDQSVISDPGDGFQAVITNIIASTGAATALNFFLEEGSTKIFGPIYLEAVAGRGFASGPIYLPCTASTAVTLTSSAAIAQSFQVQYFIQAV